MIVYEDDLVTLYCGDMSDILPAIVADIMVTDPPYGIEVAQNRKMPGMQQFEVMAGDSSNDAVKAAIEIWGSRPMLLFGANHFPHLLPEPGVWHVWDKRCSEKADRMFGAPFELAWQTRSLGKQFRMHRIQHGGVVNADGWGEKRVHPTQKPVVLLERIIEKLPDGVVVDPFAGSGSTLIAARRLGRTAIGIEIEPTYAAIAAERLRSIA